MKKQLLFILMAYLTSCVSLSAQNQRFDQMDHSSWTGKDGAPQAITSLAQTSDGRLWMASRAGLFSFDGLTFKQYLFSDQHISLVNGVRDLFVSRQGDLWVTGTTVGVVRLSHGKVLDVGFREDGTPLSVTFLQEDLAGRMWAIAGRRDLVRLGEDHLWHKMPGPVLAPKSSTGFFIDSRGTQWLVTDLLLYRKTKDESTFHATANAAEGEVLFSEDSDGSLWLVAQMPKDPTNLRGIDLRHLDQEGNRLPFPLKISVVGAILTASDGSLLMTQEKIDGHGFRSTVLARQSKSSKGWTTDDFNVSDGLIRINPNALLSDRDGAIWVGGDNGLDRFRPSILAPISSNSDTDWTLCSTHRGVVWAAGGPGPLLSINGSQKTVVTTPRRTKQLLCAPDGRLWMINDLGLSELSHGLPKQVPPPPGFGAVYNNSNYVAIAAMGTHGLLVSAATPAGWNLWAYNDHKWTAYQPLYKQHVVAMFQEPNGVIYLKRRDGGIDRVNHGHIEPVYPAGTQLDLFSGFVHTTFGLFCFGQNGLVVMRNSHAAVLKFADPRYGEQITGLVQSGNEDLWLNGVRGVVRVRAGEILEGTRNPRHLLFATEIHEGDFVGPAPLVRSSGTAAIGSDGTLWFTTLNGVVSLNPSALDSRKREPLLNIGTIAADGNVLGADDAFPPHVLNLTIKYFGVHLSDPTKVIYRYQLSGVNDAWQEVGNRTEAIYTQLKPGRYTFQVSASNGDGIWTPPQSVKFRIKPAFTQTLWFSALCLLAAILLIAAALRARIRYLARAIQIGIEERANERVRIARDLHDTLLQGVHGLMLSFHVAAERLPQHDDSKQLLDRALGSADRLIVEARDRVSNLRAEHLTRVGLVNAIRAVAVDLDHSQKITCNIESVGVGPDLPPYVAGQIFYIAREAMTNAFRHADASQIDIELQYSASEFSFTCRDNGKGFDRLIFLAGHTDGHWGIRGTMERAAEIGGTIDWLRADGGGTIVRFSMPRSRFAALRRWLFGLVGSRPMAGG
jgi:signal transduction histidine kinase